MVRLRSFLLMGTSLLLTSVPFVDLPAQNVPVASVPPSSIANRQIRLSPEETAMRQNSLQKAYPLLFARQRATTSTSAAIGGLQRSALSPAPPLRSIPKFADSQTVGREMWGNVITDNTWASGNSQYGIYKFRPQSSIAVTPLCTDKVLMSNGAGAIVGNRVDLINYDTSFGMVFIMHYQFDADTWEQVGTGNVLNDMSLIGFETAVASDGTVYGEFMSSDGKKLELGIVDYATLSRTTIGELTRKYVAMGITKNNTLYGIAADGNLYKIDTS